MTQKEFNKIVKDWVLRKQSEKQFDLFGINLSGMDLRNVNLRNADLRNADLRNADLRNADLRSVNLHNANLHNANLRDANLRNADLRNTYICNANLRGANLRGANLCGANLCGTNLCDVDYDENTSFYALQCPGNGDFIAWKKANGCVVQLRIPADALRTSATSRKCRASKAEVLGIYDIEKDLMNIDEIRSDYDKSFIYRVGEIVSVDDFEENRWIECAAGIHFFLTFDEAKNY